MIIKKQNKKTQGCFLKSTKSQCHKNCDSTWKSRLCIPLKYNTPFEFTQTSVQRLHLQSFILDTPHVAHTPTHTHAQTMTMMAWGKTDKGQMQSGSVWRGERGRRRQEDQQKQSEEVKETIRRRFDESVWNCRLYWLYRLPCLNLWFLFHLLLLCDAASALWI